jgi:hypothetical protein
MLEILHQADWEMMKGMNEWQMTSFQLDYCFRTYSRVVSLRKKYCQVPVRANNRENKTKSHQYTQKLLWQHALDSQSGWEA